MAPLSVLFPEMEVIGEHGTRPTDLPATIPDAWREILSLPLPQRRERLARLLQLSEGSPGERMVLETEAIALLIPKAKRRRNDPRFHELAVLFRSNRAMTFSRPDDATPTVFCAKEYVQQCADIGVETTGLVRPAALARVSAELQHQVARRTGRHVDLVAFWGGGSGDYHCWVDADVSHVWYYEPDTGEVEPLSSATYRQWFEERLVSGALWSR